MPELSDVRSQIKTWERDFKAQYGRDPKVQDIREQPPVAELYKLYKKLSKAASASTQSQGPSTPPRSHPRDSRSFLLARQRAVETSAPLATFNPFSPQKNKGKQNEILKSAPIGKLPPNPFATPVKGKPSQIRQSLPDPFPPIQPFELGSSLFAFASLPDPLPTSALTRARKRLRGEPVSPSPNKDKRRRVASQAALPFPAITRNVSSDDELDDDGPANSSLVFDSPMKPPPNGGKSFHLLFEENVPQNAMPTTKTFSRTKTATGLFGEKLSTAPAILGNEKDPIRAIVNPAVKGAKLDRRQDAKNGKLSIPTGVIPSNDSLFAEDPDIQNTNDSSGEAQSDGRRSSKRSLSDSETETRHGPTDPRLNTQPLLPPSPPPIDSSHRSYGKYQKGGRKSDKPLKNKANAASRKKPKLEKDADTDEESSSEGCDNVRVIARTTRPQAEDDGDLESDPILAIRALEPRGEGSLQNSSFPVDDAVQDGQFEVNLPDTLRRVLAISPSKTNDTKKEKLVRGLLYGTRELRYDPVKGGEIWDAGEWDGQLGETDCEDDWEGEPIPWEQGEL